MLKLLIIAGIILLFGASALPRLGRTLGSQARKPFRQAKWMWSWFAGSEEDSLRAEQEYGQECAHEFATQFSGEAPGNKQTIVGEVGSRLANAVKGPRREFRFWAVAAPITNAFALPGGYVFVTEPLLDLCECDRDEIAFFLGHEMGHILRGHTREQLTANTILNAVAARLPGAGQMLRNALSRGYSRELELEADREAVRLAKTAGFDPAGAQRALRRLAQLAPDRTGMAEYFASHPPFAERLRELET